MHCVDEKWLFRAIALQLISLNCVNVTSMTEQHSLGTDVDRTLNDDLQFERYLEKLQHVPSAGQGITANVQYSATWSTMTVALDELDISKKQTVQQLVKSQKSPVRFASGSESVS